MYYDYVCLHTVLQVATILLVVNCIGRSRLYEHVSLDVYTQYVLEKDTIKQDATDISKQVFFLNVHLRRSWKGNVQLCWHPTLPIWIFGQMSPMGILFGGDCGGSSFISLKRLL